MFPVKNGDNGITGCEPDFLRIGSPDRIDSVSRTNRSEYRGPEQCRRPAAVDGLKTLPFVAPARFVELPYPASPRVLCGAANS